MTVLFGGGDENEMELGGWFRCEYIRFASTPIHKLPLLWMFLMLLVLLVIVGEGLPGGGAGKVGGCFVLFCFVCYFLLVYDCE